MRSVSIGNEMTVKIKSKMSKQIEVKSKINLEKIYTDSIKVVKNISPLIIEKDKFKIECSVPNILSEYNIEKYIQNKHGDEEIKTNAQLRKNVGEKFITELSKYINKLTIEDTEIVFEDISWKDKINILERLPSKLMEDVYTYIETITKEIKKITIIDKTITINGEKERVKHELDINPGFFTNS
jgi:hypothetical protein